MDTSPPTVRSHKLLQKFAPSRWRQPRHARSQDGLTTHHERADKDSTDQLPPSVHFRALSLAPNAIQENSTESLVLAALTSTSTSEVPPYTPMPVPERVSSAKNIKDLYHPPRVSSAKRDSAIYRLFPKEETDDQRDSLLDKVRATNSLQNDHAHAHGPVFEDDLLLPQPSVPFRGRPKDMPSRDSGVSKESSSATTSRPRGRSRGERSPTISPVASTPATETESVVGPTNTSPIEVPVFPQPDRNRIQSPGGSILANIPAAPTKLSNDVVAHLQDPSPDKFDILNTDLNNVDDPNSWDLINREAKPIEERDASQFWLEKRAEQLYSAEHLHLILNDSKYYSKFLGFMRKYRPWRVPILTYYSESFKAIKAQDYANSLTAQLADRSPLPNGNAHPPGPAENTRLHDAAREAFAELLKDDLHYFIAHTYVKIVSALVARRITGTLPAHLDEASGRLAEVFCITDCRLRDDPLILASEGFTRHSGGSLEYVLGRNCRFMQGPGTTVDSCRRFAMSCQEQRDHTEIFVNYRRDGTPFLSLVMNAPLIDSQGNVRYFLGAQVDVSALLKECAGIESLSDLITRQATPQKASNDATQQQLDPREQIKSLCEMFSGAELDIIRRHGGSAQRGRLLDTRTTKAPVPGSRVLLADGSEDSDDAPEVEPSVHESITSGHALGSMDGTPGNLSGVYKYYLLVRPAPSLRVLFASPTMRVPGILQSPFLHRICRRGRVRDNLEDALREGKGVTARVRWLNKPSEEGEGPGVTRWLHCTPLIHYTGQVGLWMILLVRPDVDGATMTSELHHTNSSVGSRTGSRMGVVGRQQLQQDGSTFSGGSIKDAEISFD